MRSRYRSPHAARRLSEADPVLAKVIARVGPFTLKPVQQDTFEAILQSICYQQLNGKAASTIHGRVIALFKGAPVAAAAFSKLKDADLRAAGLSANKLLAMRDLAAKSLAGVVPPRKELEELSDEEIVQRLVEVRGVGRWTAQMFLMFRLGRPDVMPSDDYGIRKAFGLLYRKSKALPPPAAVEKHAKAWAPYRTIACWYLWRSLDVPEKPVPRQIPA